MPYLMDASAWVRAGHPEIRRRWRDLLDADELLCSPVFALEVLHTARSSDELVTIAGTLADAFDWRVPDAETGDRALALQAQMAVSDATGQRVKTPDLQIAALALQHGVGVLHYDGDYDLIRDRGDAGLDSEWVAERGSLQGRGARDAADRKTYLNAFEARMAAFTDDADLAVWPDVLRHLDEAMAARGLPTHPPADVHRDR